MLAHQANKNGSAGEVKSRTYWNLCLTIGIPFSRWGAKPFISTPLAFPAESVSSLAHQTPKEPKEQRPHPFELALRWRLELKNNPNLTQASIGQREGLSRARVTQILNLLQLPGTVQAELLSLPAPLNIYSFNERSLRAIVACGSREIRISRWRELIEKLKNSVHH